jgi:hypothetical protein
MYSLNDILSGNETTLANSVNSAPVVEPLSGPVSVEDIFDRFPDSIYQQGRDTHLYHFLEALCGDAGAGFIKKQSYRARMSNEAEYLTFRELDAFYGDTLGFPRLATETYSEDPLQTNLTEDQWKEIQRKDDSYKHRLSNYINASRVGNTPEGMQYAAQAGSGVAAEIIEHYRFIYDLYSDSPIDVVPAGKTVSTNEFVVHSLILDRDGVPVRDGATVVQSGTTTTGSKNIVDLTNTSDLKVGNHVSGTGIPANSVITKIRNDFSVEINNAMTANGTVNITFTPVDEVSYNSGMERVTVFNTATFQTLIIRNASKKSLRLSLGENIPITSAQQLNNLLIQSSSKKVYVDTVSRIETTSDWRVDPADGFTRINPADESSFNYPRMLPEIERNMLSSLDRFRPVGALMTIETQTNHFTEVKLGAAPFATSERIFVSRFVNGNVNIQWPEEDNEQGMFIVAGQEREMIHGGNARELPVIFQNIDGILAYNDRVLNPDIEPTYGTSAFYENISGQPRSAPFFKYQSEHTGDYDKLMRQIFPFLRKVPYITFDAKRAIAINNTPLIVEGRS